MFFRAQYFTAGHASSANPLCGKTEPVYLVGTGGRDSKTPVACQRLDRKSVSNCVIRGDIVMKPRFSGMVMAVFAVLAAAAPAFAHHGFTVEFDASKCMDLKGTLTGIDWENPHAYFHMDVKGADGNVQSWRLEMITPNALKRNGTSTAGFPRKYGQDHLRQGLPGQGRRHRLQRSCGIPRSNGRKDSHYRSVG